MSATSSAVTFEEKFDLAIGDFNRIAGSEPLKKFDLFHAVSTVSILANQYPQYAGRAAEILFETINKGLLDGYLDYSTSNPVSALTKITEELGKLHGKNMRDVKPHIDKFLEETKAGASSQDRTSLNISILLDLAKCVDDIFPQIIDFLPELDDKTLRSVVPDLQAYGCFIREKPDDRIPVFLRGMSAIVKTGKLDQDSAHQAISSMYQTLVLDHDKRFIADGQKAYMEILQSNVLTGHVIRHAANHVDDKLAAYLYLEANYAQLKEPTFTREEMEKSVQSICQEALTQRTLTQLFNNKATSPEAETKLTALRANLEKAESLGHKMEIAERHGGLVAFFDAAQSAFEQSQTGIAAADQAERLAILEAQRIAAAARKSAEQPFTDLFKPQAPS